MYHWLYICGIKKIKQLIMKKTFLLLISLLMTSISLFAQTQYYQTNGTGTFESVSGGYAEWLTKFSAPTTTAPTPDANTWGAPAYGSISEDNVFIIEPGDTVVLTTTVNFPPNTRVVVRGAFGIQNLSTPFPGTTQFQLNGYLDISDDPGQFGFEKGATGYYGTGYQLRFVNNVGADGVYVGGFDIEGTDFLDAFSGPGNASFWTGAVNNDWSNVGNWSNGVPNDINTNAIIPSSYGDPNDASIEINVTNFPIVTSGQSFSSKRLTVYENASLTLESSGFVTVDRCLGNFGSITVKAGGGLIQNELGTLVCNLGNFNVELDLLDSPSPHFIGSPISSIIFDGFGIASHGLSGAFTLDPSDPCPEVNENFGSFEGLMQLDQSNSVDLCSHELWTYKGSGNLTEGRGYAAYLPGGGTITFSGDVNNGPISYGPLGHSSAGDVDLPPPFESFTSTRGWHMVSNPYPSPIEIPDGYLTGAGFDAQVYFWDASANDFTFISNTGNNVPIAVGQGFQIRVTGVGNSSTIEFDNSWRTDNFASFLKSNEELDNFIKINLSHQNNNIHADEALVIFREDATEDFDSKYDINRLFGNTQHATIYTRVGNETAAQNNLPLLEVGEQVSVDMGFYQGNGSEFELTFEHLNSLQTDELDVAILLEDKKLDELIQVDESTIYQFAHEMGDAIDRFVLHFHPTAKSAEEEEDVLSIGDITKNQILLFPNPTNGDVRVSLDENHDFNVLKVTNLTGKLVTEIALNNHQKMVNLNLGNLSDGLYFITLNGNSSQIVKKVIKN